MPLIAHEGTDKGKVMNQSYGGSVAFHTASFSDSAMRRAQCWPCENPEGRSDPRQKYAQTCPRVTFSAHHLQNSASKEQLQSGDYIPR